MTRSRKTHPLTRTRPQMELLEGRDVPATALVLSNNTLIPITTDAPATAQTPIAVTGLTTGDTLVGIDVRPQNGLLYGLGANPVLGTVQLYLINPRTGFASPITPATPNQFVDAGGLAVAINATSFGFDFNPAADRIRVVTGSGQNFRMNPNTGAFIDGDLNQTPAPAGVNMDGPINGPVATSDGAAYTNNVQNTTITTLYTFDGTVDALYIQTPPNSGTQTNTLLITLNGATLDFTTANGFDIAAGVDAPANNAPVTAGSGLAALTVGGVTNLYSINLVTGAATLVGPIGAGTLPVQGLAIVNDSGGLPAVALNATGNGLVRFNTATPATSTAITVTGVDASEVLVGIDYRPATGQLFGLGVNDAADTGTLYILDPQTGAATVVGAVGSIAYVDATGTPIALPAATVGYGFDFNPTVDRIRIVTGTGLNARANPVNGLPVDGNPGPAGNQPDAAINGIPTGVESAAYTNSFGQVLPGTATTLYTLAAANNVLYIQNPANGGTQTIPVAVTLGGAPLDFTAINGFDIAPGVAVTTPNAVAAGVAYAALTVGGATNLYTIDLTTGVAALLGAAPGVFSGLAVGDGPAAAGAAVTVGGSLNGALQLLDAASGTVTAGAAVTAFPGTAVNVRSTTGDVNGDGVDDVIAVTGPGTVLRLTVISGADNTTVLVPPTAPFAGSESFAGGGFVASGDFDNDGRDEIAVTADQGGGSRVTIFSLVGTTLTVRANFFGITGDDNFRGGSRPAVGDVNNDGTPDIAVAAGFLGGPRVAIFTGTSVLGGTPTKLLNDFFAFPGEDATRLRNGSFVALGDVNGDGFDDAIFGGGPGGAPRVFILSGALLTAGNVEGAYAAPVANFFVANNSSDRGGIRVAAVDVDGDARADVAVGSGEGVAARVRIYRGVNFVATTEPTVFQDINVFGGAVLANGVFVG